MSACSSAISSRADPRAAPPGAFAPSSRIRSTSRSGCGASRRSRGSPSGQAPRSTSTRSGTSSSSTEPTTSRRSKSSVALQNELGVPSRFVEPGEIRELCPIAGLDGVLAATYCPLDGHASPEAVAQGYAAGARRHGATVVTGCAVTGVTARRHGDPRRSRRPSAQSRPPRSSARPARGHLRSRVPSASSFPSSRTSARSDSPARPTACPRVSRSRSTSRRASTSTAKGRGSCSGWPTATNRPDSTSRPISRGSRESWRSPNGACRHSSIWASPAAGRGTTK